MANTPNNNIEETIDNLNTQLSRTSLDANNNSQPVSASDVIQAIDDYLNDVDISHDFEDITEDDFHLLDTDDVILGADLPDYEDTDAAINVDANPSELDKLVDHYNAEHDIVAHENRFVNPPTPLPQHPDPADDVSSLDSISPSPSVSPILRNDATISENLPSSEEIHTYVVRVYGRQFSDYRSDSIFYGTFATPYLDGSIQSRLQLRSLVARANQHIANTRPLSTLQSNLWFNMTKPEISYISSTGQRVNVYPRDYDHTVTNLRIPEPWNSNGIAHINISVLVRACPRDPAIVRQHRNHQRQQMHNLSSRASSSNSNRSSGDSKRRRHN
jgi:hypothetical protein